MVGESVAIVVVLLVAGLMALRSGRRDMAKMTVPFFCVSAFYLAGEAAFYAARRDPGFPLQLQRALTVALGGLAGIALAYLIAGSISSRYKNPKRTYVPFAAVFLAALVFVYFLRLL